MGPTASGKTDLALALSESFPVEIVSVDSAQIYRGMDIGSGKPSQAVLQKVPHHLIDIRSPHETYSVAQFREDTLKILSDITARDRIPLLVGGTMLYFRALQQGLSPLPASDNEIREALTLQLQEEGLQALYQRLKDIDPITAQRLHPSDQQRIQRALEVFMMTGKPMSFWLKEPIDSPSVYRFVDIGLVPLVTPRSELHSRIEQRFENMLLQGLVVEVEKLFTNEALHAALPALRSVGYRQVWQYLSKEISFEQMKEKAIAATRQLAKRQLTWLRQWSSLHTFDFLDPNLLKKVGHYLNN